MRIALIEQRGNKKYACVNKDESATFGTATHSRGLFGKLLGIVKSKSVHIPVLHMAYINAIFKKYGHDVYYSNKFEKTADIVIIASSIVDYKNEINLARDIKKEYPKSRVGFIGAFASTNPDIFTQYCDFIIKNEPEPACINIASNNLKPEGIIDSPPISNLDALPFPNWSGFPLKEYSYFPMLTKKPLVPMLTSRGCSFSCNYCPYIVFQTKKWRKRSVKNTVDEIEYLISNHSIKSIIFRDPVYTLDTHRSIEISKEILRRGIKIEWGCETRVDCLDEKTIDWMKDSGMASINLGIESSSQKILRNASRKPDNDEHQIKIIRYLQKKKIRISAFYIFGFKDDTEKSINDTINYAKFLNTTVAQFHLMNAYPGTEFFSQVKDKIIANDWERFDNYTPIVKSDYLTSEQLLGFKDKAFRSYYLRASWIFKNGLRLLL